MLFVDFELLSDVATLDYTCKRPLPPLAIAFCTAISSAVPAIVDSYGVRVVRDVSECVGEVRRINRRVADACRVTTLNKQIMQRTLHFTRKSLHCNTLSF